MNTSRRGFLGSILGTYVATQLPWYARLATSGNRYAPFSFLTATNDDLMRCKSNLILGDNRIIKGPTILEAAKPDTLIKTRHPLLGEDEIDHFRFVFAPVEMLKALTVRGIELIDPYGNSLVSNSFKEGSQILFPGDTLNAIQRIYLALDKSQGPAESG